MPVIVSDIATKLLFQCFLPFANNTDLIIYICIIEAVIIIFFLGINYVKSYTDFLCLILVLFYMQLFLCTVWHLLVQNCI